MTGPLVRPAADQRGHSGATVDLHLHSTASDGLLAPAAVVSAARVVGLTAIALTDHDTVGGIAEARATAEQARIRFVAGIELSAEEDGVEIHILGLHLVDVTTLQERLRELQAERVDRARAIVARLAELGVFISYDAVLAHAAGGAVGRPHVARAMLDAGVVHDFREAFDRYLGAARPAFIPKKKLSVRDAVSLVHAAGGLAVWAHPGTHAGDPLLTAVTEAGLDGLEVLHPSHGPEMVSRLSALCDARNLVPSGGSDWHATPGAMRTVGSQAVPLEWLQRQDAALAARGSPARPVFEAH
ncbi:MAG TPA: PHP domain-containing protein [Gemmatimonadaceae bacterium]|nr:PHP domain-containing protein [Gemmatimonadaceae bacterium]